jgi:hypothetical protein
VNADPETAKAATEHLLDNLSFARLGLATEQTLVTTGKLQNDWERAGELQSAPISWLACPPVSTPQMLGSLSTPSCGKCDEIHGGNRALELLQSSHTFTPLLTPVSPQINYRCYRALLWLHAAQNCFLVLLQSMLCLRRLITCLLYVVIRRWDI